MTSVQFCFVSECQSVPHRMFNHSFCMCRLPSICLSVANELSQCTYSIKFDPHEYCQWNEFISVIKKNFRRTLLSLPDVQKNISGACRHFDAELQLDLLIVCIMVLKSHRF